MKGVINNHTKDKKKKKKILVLYCAIAVLLMFIAKFGIAITFFCIYFIYNNSLLNISNGS